MKRKHDRARGCASLALTALALAAQTARADGEYFSPTNERVRLSLGVMHVSSSTDLRVDSSADVQGTAFNAEQRFGLEKSDFEPKFEAQVRVATRHRLSFDYFTLDRTGNTTVVGTPIVFRDVVLQPGDPLHSKLSLRTLGISYGYSFWHSETLEFAATLGVHDTDVSAEARVQSPTRHIIQTEDHAGPIPTLGIDGTWVVSRRFYLDGRAQYLRAHIKNVSGSLGLYELNALYRYRPNVSLGIGYTDIRAHLDSMKSGQAGLANFNTQGPQAFFRIAF